MDHGVILQQYETLAGRCYENTGLPRLFVRPEAFESAAAVASEIVAAAAVPAVREVPYDAFTAEELWGERPDTLPPGFYLRRTPTEVTNNTRKDNWAPNMWALTMGPGYRKLLLRNVRNAERTALRFTAACWTSRACCFTRCLCPSCTAT